MKNRKILDHNGYKLTNYRVHCRRGVIWLGQTCNQKCKFCYFVDKVKAARHPEHPFMSIAKAKTICKTLVDVYNNNSIDIQGGEPTIYPHIHELIHYCSEIGLKPTLITNALVLEDIDKCCRLKDAGVFDLLISVHALGETFDELVQVKGGNVRQLKALDNLLEIGIPFRFNTVLSKEVLPQLMDIASLAVEKGARACNFIAFNPSVDQNGKRNTDNVPKYTEIIEYLIPVINYLDGNTIEVNVRYLPFCVFEEKYRKFIQNSQQVTYDLHEWETGGERWTNSKYQKEAARKVSRPINLFDHLILYRKFFRSDYQRYKLNNFFNRLLIRSTPEDSLDLKEIAEYHKMFFNNSKRYKVKFFLRDLGPFENASIIDYAYKEFKILTAALFMFSKCKVCYECSLSGICDGLHNDYTGFFGIDEFRPLKLDTPIFDPRHYIYDQMKVVEKQEYTWALPLNAIPTNTP